MSRNAAIAEAIDAIERAIEAHPERGRFRFGKAKLMLLQGEAAGAEVVAAEACRLEPTHPQSHRLLAQIRYRLGRHEAALGPAESFVRLKPRSPGAHHLLGVIRLALEDLDASEQAFETAISLRPLHLAAHRNLLRVYRRQGRPGRAIVCGLRLLLQAPHYAGRVAEMLREHRLQSASRPGRIAPLALELALRAVNGALEALGKRFRPVSPRRHGERRE